MSWSDHFCGTPPRVELFDDISVLLSRLQRELEQKPLQAQEIQTTLERLSTDIGFDVALGAARSCYSGSLVSPLAVRENLERARKIAQDTYKARHHTPYMHRNYVFGLDGVSRQFIWSHLHAHPFYNSEQVSQRYKKMSIENTLIPRLPRKARNIFIQCVKQQFYAYERLRDELLLEAACEEYYSRFPSRRSKHKQNLAKIKKKTQEAARYVIGLNTTAHLYHSINAITLARYYRLSNQPDTPTEARHIIGEMVRLVKERDPGIAQLFEDPLPEEELLEHKLLVKVFSEGKDPQLTRQWAQEFDEQLEGRVTKLTSYKTNAIPEMLLAVRDMLGVPSYALNDSTILEYLFDPAHNTHRGDVLTLDHMQKLARAQIIPHFTFMMKISATADAQEQRQRMTPGARPLFEQVILNTPDFITPSLVQASGPQAIKFYEETMHHTWNARNQLLEMGVRAELANYLLPNGVALRFRESVDLLNFKQKDEKRECLNAQEEIGRLTIAQRQEIERVHPELKGIFGPPCYLRTKAQVKPPCPEGDLFCGVRVWKGLEQDSSGNLKHPDLAIENIMKQRKF
ncbi:FAD-dependent thymidylate synthase [Candidatus Woesearchaeota archaeon]|nr:MAG: FAD-dependent thymidylate synthase [Candidatus Woesearchaeota archaeon]